jgi:hypothetical protein
MKAQRVELGESATPEPHLQPGRVALERRPFRASAATAPRGASGPSVVGRARRSQRPREVVGRARRSQRPREVTRSPDRPAMRAQAREPPGTCRPALGVAGAPEKLSAARFTRFRASRAAWGVREARNSVSWGGEGARGRGAKARGARGRGDVGTWGMGARDESRESEAESASRGCSPLALPLPSDDLAHERHPRPVRQPRMRRCVEQYDSSGRPNPHVPDIRSP